MVKSSGMWVVFLWVMLGSGLPPVLAQDQVACRRAVQDYRVALQSYEDGLFDPAIAGFEAYLKQCPHGEHASQAHYLLADIALKQERFTQALTHAKAVIARVPHSPVRPHAFLVGAQSALHIHQPQQARTYLRELLASGAQGEVRAVALYWLGEVASRQQQYDEAQRWYHTLLREMPASPYAVQGQYALGWVARQRQDFPTALQAFTAFIQSAPTHALVPQARLARADLLRETGELDKAAAAFQQLVQEGPATLRDEALFWSAELAYRLGRYDAAWTAYQRLLAGYPKSPRRQEGRYGAGWTAVQLQRCVDAVPLWEEWLTQAQDDARAVDIRYQLGLCALQGKRLPAARAYLQQVAEATGDNRQRQDALVKLGTLAFQAQNYTEAIQHYTRALTVADDATFRLHYLVGESYAALGELGQAREHWQRALDGPSSLPFYAYALYRLGQLRLAERAWPEAITLLRRLWEDFPQFPERTSGALALGQAYRNARRCDEARPFYVALLQTPLQVEESRPLVQAHAMCLFEAKQYADVVQLLGPLFSDAQAPLLLPRALYALGQSYVELQRYDEATEPLTVLRQHFPHHPLRLAMAPRFAFVLEHTGRGAEALATWQDYLRHGTIPDDAERLRLSLHAGQLAFRESQWDNALSLLAPVRGAASPALAAQAVFWTAEVYLKQQQIELAQQVYQELLDQFREQEHLQGLARLRLGTIYEQQHEWEQALQVYQALLDTAEEAALLTQARQRIKAIEAARVGPKTAPQTPAASMPAKG